MQFKEIDRFSESHDATLANITAILYERLGCTQDESYDYILEKLREIKDFDSCKSELGFSLPLVYKDSTIRKESTSSQNPLPLCIRNLLLRKIPLPYT